MASFSSEKLRDLSERYSELAAAKVRIITQVVVIQSRGIRPTPGPRATQFNVAVSGGVTELAAFLSRSFPVTALCPPSSLFFMPVHCVVINHLLFARYTSELSRGFIDEEGSVPWGWELQLRMHLLQIDTMQS